MKFYDLTLGILATWRVTYFFQAEDGPWDIVVRLRRFVGNGFWGTLLDCFYCLSVWIAAPFACWLGETWGERFFLWLSFSGGASIIHKITNRQPMCPRHFLSRSPARKKHMACCGQKRSELVRRITPVRQYNSVPATNLRPGQPQIRLRPSVVAFQYTGTTTLTAVGPPSQRRYHFAGPGAVVEVDPRDRASLANVPNLRQV